MQMNFSQNPNEIFLICKNILSYLLIFNFYDFDTLVNIAKNRCMWIKKTVYSITEHILTVIYL